MIPSGAECQCPACGRIFGGLSGFDAHQRWTGKGQAARLTCQDPALLGYEPRNRREGAQVWVKPLEGWNPSEDVAEERVAS